MKYRDLVQFNPIESVIVLRSADDRKKAEELVRSYVMSDSMAELIQAKILSQLQLESLITRAFFWSATMVLVNRI